MIDPRLLVDQVKNTVPFVFEPGFEPSPRAPHLRALRAFDVSGEIPGVDLQSPEGLYYLNLCAHHASVAGFVPTDVDVHIRQKMWQPTLSSDSLRRMVESVIESAQWSERQVSSRGLVDPFDSARTLSGHQGEWLSTAAAAYGALLRRPEESTDHRHTVMSMILSEVEREAAIYAYYRSQRQGIELLKAATLIAHNLGDLDRVIEAWAMPSGDPLKQAVYKLGQAPEGATRASEARTLCAEAGELNRRFMANENHRHFALRPVRCLRRRAEFLLPIPPFLEEWGERLARSTDLVESEKSEIASALVLGFQKLGGAVIGYARALVGLERGFVGGASRLQKLMPSRLERELRGGALRRAMSESESTFVARLAASALKSLPVRRTAAVSLGFDRLQDR